MRKVIFPNTEDDPEEWRDCLRRFAERAWRRSVTDPEIERFVGFINSELEAGE